MNCPQCGEKCEADFVDIGVGEQQVSPYYCPNCDWSQESPELFGALIDEEIVEREEE